MKNMETDVYKIMQKYTALLKEKMELEESGMSLGVGSNKH